MDAIIATAGWSVPTNCTASFATVGTALERYSGVFRGVEINSSFHRPHRPTTWARWAQSVPADFRFSVKIPKTITHAAKLRDCGALLSDFVGQIEPLGDKLAVLLVQLPPKLGLDPGVAEAFFGQLGELTGANVACEPRNAEWFEEEADALLRRLGVARVAADPALGPTAAVPGGWPGLSYWRLHGSPVMYRSSYGDEALASYARRMRTALSEGRRTWCVFDNTASSAATGNALSLQAMLKD